MHNLYSARVYMVNRISTVFQLWKHIPVFMHACWLIADGGISVFFFSFFQARDEEKRLQEEIDRSEVVACRSLSNTPSFPTTSSPPPLPLKAVQGFLRLLLLQKFVAML